jgi:two-component system chemotaxis response regulator CheY
VEDPNIIRTLVVDDSRIMRNIVMESLRKSALGEFEFTEAGSGSEAMEIFDADKIDMIFVDWNMPGMNGIEFARFIRSSQWANHIPIVMVTSETGDAKQKDAYDKARISCYITKPFTVDEIREKIYLIVADVLKRKSQQAAKTAGASPAVAPKTGGFFSKLLN